MDLLSPWRPVHQVGSAGAPRPGVWALGALAGLLGLGLAGCSAVPDALNPVEWISSADSYLSGETDETDPELAERAAAERAQPVPGADEPFPTLGAVPDEPPTVTTYEERQQIAEGLVADRASTRYADNPAAGAFSEEQVSPWREPTAPAATVSQPAPAPEVTVSAPAPPPAPAATDAEPPPPRRAEPPPPAPVATATPELSAPPPTTVAEAATRPPAPAATAPMASRQEPMPTAAGPATGMVQAGVIYFAHGSTRLSAGDRDVLAQIADIHKARGGTVRVVGHASRRTDGADPVEAKIANFATALDRARVVAQELARLGVPAERIRTSSMSDDSPAYSEATRLGEAANRRADIFIHF